MCKKLICLISVVVLTGLVLTSTASAADPNLIGWWKLDEDTGTTTADSSSHGNNGTFGVDLNGLPDSNNAPEWADGRRGERSLYFDYANGNDFVTCGNDPNFDVNGPMTVMAWEGALSTTIRTTSSSAKATPGSCICGKIST